MEEQSNLLEEFTSANEPAQRVKRFANYIVDMIVLYVLLFGIAILIASADSSFFTNESTGETNEPLIYLISILVMFSYFTIMEKSTNGRTIGKFLTGTRAIRGDGKELTMKDAALRTLCRFVPFEPLSGFGTPWHDSWTKTTVVNAR